MPLNYDNLLVDTAPPLEPNPTDFDSLLRDIQPVTMPSTQYDDLLSDVGRTPSDITNYDDLLKDVPEPRRPPSFLEIPEKYRRPATAPTATEAAPGAIETAGREAVKGAGPMAAGLAAFGAVAEPLTVAAVPFAGPVAPLVGLAGGLIAGAGAGLVASGIQKKIVDAIPWLQEQEARTQAGEQAHPVAAAVGGFIPTVAGFRVAPLSAVNEFRALVQIAKGGLEGTALGTAKKQAQALVAKFGIGVVQPIISEGMQGKLPTPGEIGESAATMILLGAPRPWAARLMGQKPTAPEVPPPTEPGALPEIPPRIAPPPEAAQPLPAVEPRPPRMGATVTEDVARAYGIPMEQAEAVKVFMDSILLPEEQARIALERGAIPAGKGKGIKGETEFVEGGKAIIRGFEGSNVSTGIHEIGHVARRFLINREVPPEQRRGITDADIDTFEKLLGVKQRKWERQHEEAFGRHLERYAITGKAPTTRLQQVFGKLALWMKEIYQKLLPGRKIGKPMRDVMDRLVTRVERLEKQGEVTKTLRMLEMERIKQQEVRNAGMVAQGLGEAGEQAGAIGGAEAGLRVRDIAENLQAERPVAAQAGGQAEIKPTVAKPPELMKDKLRVYHGKTKGDFPGGRPTVDIGGDADIMGKGFYVAVNQDYVAKTYGKPIAFDIEGKWATTEQWTYALKKYAKNPISEQRKMARELLQEQGYDGVMQDDPRGKTGVVWNQEVLDRASGYVREGDRYVFKGEAAAIEPAAKPPKLMTREIGTDIAESIGGRLVGSTSKGIVGRDADIRIDESFDKTTTDKQMARYGLTPYGSSLVSPKEAKRSGKTYAKGWQRIEYYRSGPEATAIRADVFHDETPQAVTSKPTTIAPSERLQPGTRVKLSGSPQTAIVVRRMEPGAGDEPGQVFYELNVRGEKAIYQADIDFQPIKVTTGAKAAKPTIDYDQQLRDLGMDPDTFTNRGDKIKAIARAKAKAAEKGKGPDVLQQRGPVYRGGTPGSGTERVDKLFGEQEAAIKSRFGTTLDRMIDKFLSRWVQWEAPIVRRIEQTPLGRNVVELFTGARAAPGNAKLKFDVAHKRILDGLSQEETRLLATHLQARRAIEIGPSKKHPASIDAYQEWERNFEQNNPELFANINQRAEAYWSVARSIISDLQKEGILSETDFVNLSRKGNFYDPRVFLQHIDPVTTGVGGKGQKVSIHESGLHPLDAGSEEAMLMNPKLSLYRMYIGSEMRIARNRASRALNEYVRSTKTTEVDAQGKPFYSNALNAKEVPVVSGNAVVESGYEPVYHRENGIPKAIQLPKELAAHWNLADASINESTLQVLKVLSGAPLVKLLATGANPEFMLGNPFRDAALVLFGTREYSPTLPLAVGQQLANIYRVLKPGAKGSISYWKRLEELYRKTGSVEFLATPSLLPEGVTKMGQAMEAGNKTIEWLSAPGQKSEMMIRLALMDRKLQNIARDKGWTYERTLADPASVQTAAHVASTYIDFRQAGSLGKFLNSFWPYFNPGLQGVRSVLRTFKGDTNQKAVALYKVAQLVAGGIALTMWNREQNREALEQVSDIDKATKWIFVTPFWRRDKNGDKRWMYIGIPKDASLQVFSALGDETANKMAGEPVSMDRMALSAKNFTPVDTSTFLSPTISALVGYAANKDFWRNEDIWKGREVSPKMERRLTTPEIYKQAGDITGLSPARLEYAARTVAPVNPVTTVLAMGWDKLTNADQTSEDAIVDLSKKPFIRRFMRFTTPRTLTERERTQAEKFKLIPKGQKGEAIPGGKIIGQLKEAQRAEGDIRQRNDLELQELVNRIKTGKAQRYELTRFRVSKGKEEDRRLKLRIRDKYPELARW